MMRCAGRPPPACSVVDQVPAAVGVGGEVADQVVDAHALLDVDVGRGVQVLAQVLARLGIAQVRLRAAA